MKIAIFLKTADIEDKSKIINKYKKKNELVYAGHLCHMWK